MNTKVLWNGPCETLVEGICRQAAKDYLGKNKVQSKDAERFFRSEWFVFLTDIDGERVLNMLQEIKEGKE